MTKQEYINIKTTNPMALIYKYYTEKFDNKKHKPFLNENEFFPYIQMYFNVNEIYSIVTNHYDGYYGVATLYDKNGNILCFI